MNTITPCLWFDDQGEEAAKFYTSIFKNSQITNVNWHTDAGHEIHGKEAGSVLTVSFQLDGYDLMALNGGPQFKFTKAISLYITCQTEEEINYLWKRLSEGGSSLMALEKYPFSEKYGWLQDKYGLSWQLILPFKDQNTGKLTQKIAPCLMFCGAQQGNAEKAMDFYTSLFDNSEIVTNQHYDKNYPGPEGQVVHAEFLLNGERFIAMDSGIEQPFTFNEAVSLMVNCDTQEAIDYYWNYLIRGGDEKAQQCGWLKDKYGLSWQIYTPLLGRYISGSDREKAENVLRVMMQMKKLDISELQRAYEQ